MCNRSSVRLEQDADIVQAGGSNPSDCTKKIKLSKARKSVLVAHDRGYRVLLNGDIVSPNGKILKPYMHCGYACFSITKEDDTLNVVRVHQLAAYQKFGDRYLYSTLDVRHLNNDSTDNSLVNIAIGTRKQNARDVPVDMRALRSRKATAVTRKFDDATVRAIRKLYVEGSSYLRLANCFGCSKTTIRNIILGIMYKDVTMEA